MDGDEGIFLDDLVQGCWRKRRNISVAEEDAFVQEWWTKIQNMHTALEDLDYRASKMDQMYPYSEMPEVSCDFVGDQSAREAKSRCCKASIFRDGDYLICNQCRLVTKPVEVQSD